MAVLNGRYVFHKFHDGRPSYIKKNDAGTTGKDLYLYLLKKWTIGPDLGSDQIKAQAKIKNQLYGKWEVTTSAGTFWNSYTDTKVNIIPQGFFFKKIPATCITSLRRRMYNFDGFFLQMSRHQPMGTTEKKKKHSLWFSNFMSFCFTEFSQKNKFGCSSLLSFWFWFHTGKGELSDFTITANYRYRKMRRKPSMWMVIRRRSQQKGDKKKPSTTKLMWF